MGDSDTAFTFSSEVPNVAGLILMKLAQNPAAYAEIEPEGTYKLQEENQPPPNVAPPRVGGVVARQVKDVKLLQRLNAYDPKEVTYQELLKTFWKNIDPTQDDADVRGLVHQVEHYEKEKFEDKDIEFEEERYPYFLAVSFACLLLEWLL